MYKWFACFKSGIKETGGDLGATNRQWNCVQFRIAKNWMIQRRILANRPRELYHHILILVTKTYNKIIDRHIKCVNIVGVYSEKV